MKTKELFKFALLFFAAITIVVSGCKKDDDDDDDVSVDYYKEMTDYMAANNLDLDDMMTGWTISAHDVDSIGTDQYYIIDIRAEADYNTGHVPTAVNTTLANIVTEAANATKPIVVVCYTGQSAAHGMVALRLSGYSDAKILLFGMSSWNGDFDSWTANTGNTGTGNANWSTTNTTQTPVTFSLPEFTATATTGQEILAERVQLMLDNGFMGVTNADVLATPTNYFINNYWAETDVDHYGHISGAYRIKEDLTLEADGMKHLDPDATVVTYCWTGQTSSLVTAYLNVLGYNAKSLKFGANGMIYDALEAHKWTASGSYTYDVVN